ncbi:MAG TPA: phospho-N-acetylmuramoyl-pentapeptide-transferase [Acidimicrobiales bacterium]|nr:phospho-N-acetylmuramoyl-pentapeptide-transferase [Acidimicrobiales bacterium]
MIAVLAAALVALLIGLVGTSYLIGWFRRHGIGQPIHTAVTQHAAKAGTPTMGGLSIVLAAPIGYGVGLAVLGRAPTRTGIVLVVAILAGGAVGVLDDWMKISRGRNTLGLQERQKTLLILAVGLLLFVTQSSDETSACTAPSLARCEPFADLPGPLWLLWVLGVVWLTTNSVNFTDGLDGLLAGTSIAPLALLSLIAFWQFRHQPAYPASEGALDVALVMVAVTACCAGLLWWSAAPARVFMGETGSLAIGTAIAVAALLLHVDLLIPVFGALYVAEGLSSFAQRVWFKATRRFRRDHEPQRLFRMAPLHHHFELVTPETTVVIRFWIVSAIASAGAGAIFYWDALRVLE